MSESGYLVTERLVLSEAEVSRSTELEDYHDYFINLNKHPVNPEILDILIQTKL